jgi:hypothetical protein
MLSVALPSRPVASCTVGATTSARRAWLILTSGKHPAFGVSRWPSSAASQNGIQLRPLGPGCELASMERKLTSHVGGPGDLAP